MKNINQQGQIIVILLLLMLLVLSVVIALTQRSTTDLSTSTQTEQSTKAYSAAEAGLEKALQQTNPTAIDSQTIDLGNNSSATLQNSGLLPRPGDGKAIEYPPISKETIAQAWLTDATNAAYNYSRQSILVFFGNPNNSEGFPAYDDALGTNAKNISPALEVNIITLVNTGGVLSYQNQRTFYDSLPSRAVGGNNFTTTTSGSPIVCTNSTLVTILKQSSRFYCQVNIDIVNCQIPSCIPQLIRLRLLYANANHKIAIAPIGGAALPPQVELYTSIGKSGQSQKALQVFRIKDMVPHWMDFAIFSYSDITKN